ncbi:MAG: hypothetical protein J0H98_03585 [Solirubrobacterales bacterium]|nr:hypothetical protein [Solirubrobacterales bacterium]
MKKLIRSSALVLLVGLAVAGCGADKQEKLSLNLDTFTSPSGNIGCIADDSMVRCDIAKHDWTVKPNPKCQLDWGNGLSVAGGPGRIVCAGDTTMNSGSALATDKINMVGPFECQSEGEDGMRCENMTTGHGFELSPERYDTF